MRTDNNQHESYEAVNLGVPSGTKWSIHNVGARAAEEYGSYYAWGETREKKVYDRLAYSFFDSRMDCFATPDENICGSEYDVARAVMGDSWRMPTFEQLKELVICCSYEWTTINGIRGGRFTGSNGNSIFLPAAGYRLGTDLCCRGSVGLYWSGMMCPTFNDGAYGLDFCKREAGYCNYCDSYIGNPVRPVAVD